MGWNQSLLMSIHLVLPILLYQNQFLINLGYWGPVLAISPAYQYLPPE